MNFAIFLDVDGVLNSMTTVQRTPEGYKGIDDARVVILAKAISKYGGADLVLSSDWKKHIIKGQNIIKLRRKEMM